MKIIIAIGSFKGCLTSIEANKAAKSAVYGAFPDAEVSCVPISDGGDGWLDACHAVLGGEFVNVSTYDPLMRPIQTSYLRIGNKAIIECAKVIGLKLLDTDEFNPLKATSYGLGEMVASVVKDGCDDIVVGLGGSATSDMGIGMLRALDNAINSLSDDERDVIPENIRFTIATDVTNPLYGINGAAFVFAPQKGATMDVAELLEKRDRRFAQMLAKKMGYDCSDCPGAGAAGGLGYAFMQLLDADVVSGAELLLKAIHFNEMLCNADLVITGEGKADNQTLMGKLPFRILSHANKQRVPVWLLAGQLFDEQLLYNAGFSKIVNINPPDANINEVMIKNVAQQNLKSAIICNLAK